MRVATPGRPPLIGEMDWFRLARAYWVHERTDRALAVLDAGQQERPDDVALTELRTDILRSTGRRNVWERAGYDAHPPLDRATCAGSYAVLDRFLDESLVRELQELVQAHRDDFGASTVGVGRLDEDQRRSLRLRDGAAERQARLRFLPRLRPQVPGLMARLAPDAGPVGRIECKVTACVAGGFFKPHRDDLAHDEPGTSNHDRVLSYVCWFHREPARFTGGELVLHDARGEGYDVIAGTRFVPASGTLVVFPSGTYHSIRPVGGEPVDLVDARLAVTGHIRTQAPGGDPS